MYSNNAISLRPQYIGKREWKYGCCFTNNYNHLKLLSKNYKNNNSHINLHIISTNYLNNELNNELNNNIIINKDNKIVNCSLNLYDIPFYNKTSEYIKTIPKYIEQYNECNYDLLDKISYLYRNLLGSNEFDKFYIKKNSLKQFNNISKIATNKLHKTTISDNTNNTNNIFNTLIKNNKIIIDDKKIILSTSFVDEDYITNDKIINNDDNYSDDYDQDGESSSYPKDDLEF